jgi:adenylate cyclase
MKLPAFFIFILFFIVPNSTQAQKYKPADTVKISILLKQARAIYAGLSRAHDDNALNDVLKATSIAEAINNEEYEYVCYTALSKIYGKMGKVLLKQKYVLKASRIDLNYNEAKKNEILKLQQELDVQNSALNDKENQLSKLKDENETQKINLEKKEEELTSRDTALLMQQLETDKKVAENKLLLRDKDVAELKLLEKDRQSKQWTYAFIAAVALAVLMLYLYFSKRRHHKELGLQNDIITREKLKSDELLLNILPQKIAEELKLNGKANAQLYNNVTVMFTDFKDFSKVSEKLSPTELVKELDTFFKAFDEITTKHNIEKIKTIGDAYLCVAGLPEPMADNAKVMVEAAIEIRQFVEHLKKESEANGKVSFDIRIGLHTGSVVAGIVGLKKYAFDIWGDTVNTAARMEQSGVEGKINMSGATYELVKNKFNCTYRGKIEAKNKGEIDMYFVM